MDAGVKNSSTPCIGEPEQVWMAMTIFGGSAENGIFFSLRQDIIPMDRKKRTDLYILWEFG